MQQIASQLEPLLTQGENASLEFKEWGVRAETIAREMAGFANRQGGTILLGINDQGQIVGIPDQAKDPEEWAMNIARGNITPPIDIGFQWHHQDQRRIAQIDIPKGRDKPYQVAGKYFLRVGSTTRQASQGELLRLFQAAGFFHYDGNPIPETRLHHLNHSALEHYFQEYQINFGSESEESKRRLLINTDLMTEEGEVSVAGILLFGTDPERHLPQSGIDFAHFAGTQINSELIDKQHISGNLGFQVERALACIKNNLRNPSDIQGARRTPRRSLPPEKVFRELIVNACVHRNYAIHGSRIRIFLYSNRIEIISPGRLPNTVTLEKLRYGVSYAVNPILVKFMENLGYMDRLGRGLPMVFQEMQRIEKSIDIKELGEDLHITLFVQ